MKIDEMFLLGMTLLILAANLFLFGRSFIVYDGVVETLGYGYLFLGALSIITARFITK